MEQYKIAYGSNDEGTVFTARQHLDFIFNAPGPMQVIMSMRLLSASGRTVLEGIDVLLALYAACDSIVMVLERPGEMKVAITYTQLKEFLTPGVAAAVTKARFMTVGGIELPYFTLTELKYSLENWPSLSHGIIDCNETPESTEMNYMDYYVKTEVKAMRELADKGDLETIKKRLAVMDYFLNSPIKGL